MQYKTVLLVVGDERQKELYKILSKENFKVFSYGWF